MATLTTALTAILVHGFAGTIRTIAGRDIEFGLFVDELFDSDPFAGAWFAAAVVTDFFTDTAHG